MSSKTKNIFLSFIENQTESNIKSNCLTILSRGGLVLSQLGYNDDKLIDNQLEGALLSAITMAFNHIYESNLQQIRFNNFLIGFKRTDHFLAYFLCKNYDNSDIKQYNSKLLKLLNYLEKKCPEAKDNTYNLTKIENIINKKMY